MPIDNAALRQADKAPRQQVLVPACTRRNLVFCQNKPTPNDQDSCRTAARGPEAKGDELKDAKQRLARANDRIPLLDYWGPVPGLAHPAAGPAANGSAAVPEPSTAAPVRILGGLAGPLLLLVHTSNLKLGGALELFAAGWIWSTAVLILISSIGVTGACLSGLGAGACGAGTAVCTRTRTGEGTYS